MVSLALAKPPAAPEAPKGVNIIITNMGNRQGVTGKVCKTRACLCICKPNKTTPVSVRVTAEAGTVHITANMAVL